MEGTAPNLQRTDLATLLPDYSGTYLSYDLDDTGKVEPSLPESIWFFDKVSDGEYRFAMQGGEDKLPVFSGHLYLLDVGQEDEAVGIVYAQSRKGVQNVLFVRIFRRNEQRFDVALFAQDDAEKYEALVAVASRHGIRLDSGSEGHILGRPTGRQLRAAYLDPEFLANVETTPGSAFVLQDPEAEWPQSVEIRDYNSTGLVIVENSPLWSSTAQDGHCVLAYGVPGEPPTLAVHAVNSQLVLELRQRALTSRRDRVQLSWQVDAGLRHTLWTERPALTPDVLVAAPFQLRLLEELARGSDLSIEARGYERLTLPLTGSARASIEFAKCVNG